MLMKGGYEKIVLLNECGPLISTERAIKEDSKETYSIVQ